LGIVIEPASTPIVNYVSVQRSGNLLFFSGADPLRDGRATMVGRLGDDLSIEQGYKAARVGAICLIAALKSEVGDLDQVEQIVKLTGFVNCASGFTSQPAVINGASDLFVEVFGDKGRHARSAVGVSALPMGIPVEIEMIARVR
jgi:enamine deaminase RidA (YjgF/YER057c/UK114 family)